MNVPAEATIAALREAFAQWGRPARIRVDHGHPWGSRGDLPTELGLWLLGLGIELVYNPPRQPQQNGVVERSQEVGQRWADPACCSDALAGGRPAAGFGRVCGGPSRQCPRLGLGLRPRLLCREAVCGADGVRAVRRRDGGLAVRTDGGAGHGTAAGGADPGGDRGPSGHAEPPPWQTNCRLQRRDLMSLDKDASVAPGILYWLLDASAAETQIT